MLERNPFDGHWFVFRSRNGTRLKILTFDGVGWWLHYRRLETGRLTWPAVNGRGAIELSHAQFAVLTQGLDWRRVSVPQRLAPSLV